MQFMAEAIRVGQFEIRYYGLIIVAAMLIAATVAARLARRSKEDPEHVWGILTWAIIPGLIGARLMFILFPPLSSIADGKDTLWYFQNFFNIQEGGAVAIWTGGLHIYGAILGGLLGALIYLVRNNLNVGYWLDLAGICLPLGQAIGRFANFVNQELYGVVTTLPWGIAIDRDHRVAPYTSLIDHPLDTTRFHPLFAYEALWNLLAFGLLIVLYQRFRNRLATGDFFLLYLAQYSFIRFLLEFIRIEVALIPGTALNMAQVIAAIVFVLSLGFFMYRHRAGANKADPAAA
jgi:phosphatidylglycerol---prolipoprotein diacylglyceryl transferase